MQRLHESIQTTVHLFETSDATKRICPMTFTLVMAGTLDPLIHGFVGLRRQNGPLLYTRHWDRDGLCLCHQYTDALWRP